MELPVTFEVPDSIYAGLMKGTLTRTGGVIQRPEGQIAMWLREASPSPVMPDALGGFGNLLGMVGSVASVLNLGATVAFGTAILMKLRKIDRKLDEISAKIDKLQWTVEVGFANVLSYLETLVKYHEIELIGELKAGAELAWAAQFLEPGSPQRIARLESALSSTVRASEKLLLHCESEISCACEELRKEDGAGRLKVLGQKQLDAARRLRLAAAGVALKASIYAEMGELELAHKLTDEQGSKLRAMLCDLGFAFLRGSGSRGANHLYDWLLSSVFKEHLPVKRVEVWASRFDREHPSLEAILEMMRIDRGTLSEQQIQQASELIRQLLEKYDRTTWLSIAARLVPVVGVYLAWDLFSKRLLLERQAAEAPRVFARPDPAKFLESAGVSGAKYLPEFADLLDGAWEDVDRLLGRAAEYRYALNKGMTIQEYREMLKVNEVKEGQPLVFFVEEAESK